MGALGRTYSQRGSFTQDVLNTWGLREESLSLARRSVTNTPSVARGALAGTNFNGRGASQRATPPVIRRTLAMAYRTCLPTVVDNQAGAHVPVTD